MIGFGHRIDARMRRFGSLLTFFWVGVTTQKKAAGLQRTLNFDLRFISQWLVIPFPDRIEHAGEGTAFAKRKGMSEGPAKPFTPLDRRFATPLALVPRNVHSLGLTKSSATRADVPHPLWLEKGGTGFSKRQAITLANAEALCRAEHLKTDASWLCRRWCRTAA